MRLTCPNCDAIYEVPADAVPPEGRDVQCTNCGHAWYQEHPSAASEEAPIAPPSRQMDAEARRVLEEEAERELAERSRERRRTPRRRAEPIPPDPEVEDEDDWDEPDERDPEPALAASSRRRRDLLPDIEEIDGSLKPGSDRRGGRRLTVEEDPGAGTRSKGFRLGLGLTVLVVAALVVLYVFAPEIAARVPAAAPAMEAYAQTVDGWRAALDGAARGLSESLTAWVDSLSAPEEVGEEG